MEIVYKHKETGIKISHKDLKEKQYEIINFGCHRGYDELIASNSYKYYEIPFSDDFETICVTTEFTMEELQYLMVAITNCYLRDDEIYVKVRELFLNKRKVENR